MLFPEAADRLAALRWNLHELRRLLGADHALPWPMSLRAEVALRRGQADRAAARPRQGRE